MSLHKYGWKRDKVDRRDFLITRYLGSLPAFVDLSSECTPIRDQKQEGACTAFASCGLMEFNRNKLKLEQEIFSPQFLYYNERVIEGTVDQDSGASIREILGALYKHGVCLESLWPYSEGMFTLPSIEAVKNAMKYRITAYHRIIQAPQFLKTQLSIDEPFVFGFDVYESFESPEVAKTGIMPIPGPNEQLLGGHEVLCVGYDDAKQMYKVRNSWGTSWGLEGYFWMPYNYMHNQNLASDMWTFS